MWLSGDTTVTFSSFAAGPAPKTSLATGHCKSMDVRLWNISFFSETFWVTYTHKNFPLVKRKIQFILPSQPCLGLVMAALEGWLPLETLLPYLGSYRLILHTSAGSLLTLSTHPNTWPETSPNGKGQLLWEHIDKSTWEASEGTFQKNVLWELNYNINRRWIRRDLQSSSEMLRPT